MFNLHLNDKDVPNNSRYFPLVHLYWLFVNFFLSLRVYSDHKFFAINSLVFPSISILFILLSSSINKIIFKLSERQRCV